NIEDSTYSASHDIYPYIQEMLVSCMRYQHFNFYMLSIFYRTIRCSRNNPKTVLLPGHMPSPVSSYCCGRSMRNTLVPPHFWNPHSVKLNHPSRDLPIQ